MIKFSENLLKLPLKTQVQAHKTKKELKKNGYDDLSVRTNNLGDVAIIGKKSQGYDEFVANIIKSNGKQSMTKYKTYPKTANSPATRIVEKWDKIKNDYIFNKRVTIQYKDSKFPEVISTMYTDAHSDDGVKIVTTYPRLEYQKKIESNK